MKDNCYDIFNYLKKDGNDKLSLLDRHSRQDLFYYLDKYLLEYRNSLGLFDKDTFGIEIESESVKIAKDAVLEVKSLLDLKEWSVCKDDSISNGCEVDSPIFSDNSSCWDNILYVCSLLEKNGYFIGQRSAGHIHVGAHILGDKREGWLNFIKLWAAYEKVIYRFCYGEYLRERSGIGGFAPPIALKFFDDYSELKDNKFMSSLDIAKSISHSIKSQAVNFSNVSSTKEFVYANTIEFRCPNGSLNPVVWQNNINLFVHLLKYASSSFFDDTIVSSRFEIINKDRVKLSYYKDVFIMEALELCDLIFDNNLDKVYFLRQYLKSYEIGTSFLENAKPFVKSLNKKN